MVCELSMIAKTLGSTSWSFLARDFELAHILRPFANATAEEQKLSTIGG
jgi:hypothetical protein